VRPPKHERERLRRIGAWRGQRVEQYAEAYIRGRIDVDELDRLLAAVTEENADHGDYRFDFVADPRLISYEAR
jgi:hypothetical protein